MYAVIEQGGKQYKVAQGDVLNIDLTEVADDATTIELDTSSTGTYAAPHSRDLRAFAESQFI